MKKTVETLVRRDNIGQLSVSPWWPMDYFTSLTELKSSFPLVYEWTVKKVNRVYYKVTLKLYLEMQKDGNLGILLPCFLTTPPPPPPPPFTLYTSNWRQQVFFKASVHYIGDKREK